MARFYQISGDEDFLIERFIKSESSSFLSEETIFITKNRINNWLDNKTRTYIIEGDVDFSSLHFEESDLVFVVNPKKDLPFKSQKQKFSKFKPYEKEKIINWIIEEGERFKIDLSRVAFYLFVNLGNSLRKINSEIEKISIICQHHSIKKPTPDIIKGSLIFSVEITPKNIIDSIYEFNSKKAMTYYDVLQSRNDETGWILAYLMRSVSNQFLVNKLCHSGKSENEMSSLLGVHSFVIRKQYIDFIDSWSNEFLSQTLKKLSFLDFSHKSGKNVKPDLEIQIIQISEEPKKNV